MRQYYYVFIYCKINICIQFSFPPQLIDIMGSLLDRPLIRKDFDEKYVIIVDKMNDMLDEAKVLYDKQVIKYKFTHNLTNVKLF